MIVDLLDVELGIETGSSPYAQGSSTGLLKINESSNGVQPAVINPVIPFLLMSPETCVAIAENMLVTFKGHV